MGHAAKALWAARRAGLTVVRRGDRLNLRASVQPPADILDALRSHKPAILALLAEERCEGCHGPATCREHSVEGRDRSHPVRSVRAGCPPAPRPDLTRDRCACGARWAHPPPRERPSHDAWSLSLFAQAGVI